MPNENCLEGVKCPQCGHEDDFIINASVTAHVWDDGVMDSWDYEYDGNNPCQCGGCNHTAPLRHFTGEEVKTLKEKLPVEVTQTLQMLADIVGEYRQRVITGRLTGDLIKDDCKPYFDALKILREQSA